MSLTESTNSYNLSYDPFRQALPSLLFLVLLFFLNFTARVIFSPLLPFIERELNLNHAASGSFFFFISSGYFLSILLSGYVSERITHKRTIVLSVLSSGFVLLFVGTCVTLFQLRLALFCLGMAAGLYLPSGLATITYLVKPSCWARGMAVHELAPNFGFVAAPVLSDMALSFFSWRQGTGLFGLLIIIAGFCYFMFGKDCRQAGRSLDWQIVACFLKIPDFWILTLLFSLAICSTLGIYAMLPLFLVADQGMEMERANWLVAFSRLAAVGMPIMAGWLGDRYGNRVVMATILAAAGLFTVMLGICPQRWIILFVILQPMLAVCFFPSGFVVLSKMGQQGTGNVGVSLVIPLAFMVGGGLMPFIIGLIGDTYSIGVGFAGSGLLMFIGGAVQLLVFGKKDQR